MSTPSRVADLFANAAKFLPSRNRLAILMRAIGSNRRSDRRFAIGGATGYLALLIVAHAFHESWRDEIHCWIVGRHATGLWDLLVGIRRYDGHPFLWYEVLHVVSRVIPSIAGLHVTTVVLATLAGYLWLAKAPFPRVLRLLALGSYFLAFEYTVLCRSYVLGVFLLFAFCSTYNRQAPRYLRSFLLLALLSATSAYGFMIAVSLGLFLCLQFVRTLATRAASTTVVPGNRSNVHAPFAIGACLFGIALSIVVATTLPPVDEFFAPTWHTTLGFKQLTEALRCWWIAILPIPRNVFGWEIVPTGLGLFLPGFFKIVPGVAAVVLVVFLAMMYPSWPAIAAYVSVVVLMGVFQETRNLGDVRHWGHFFVSFLACLWLSRGDAQVRRPRLRLASHLVLGGVLLVQDATGFLVLRADFLHPFSGSAEAAQFIERAGFQNAAFVGSHDHLASAVAGRLDRPFASGNNGEFGHSVVFHNRRHPVNVEETMRLTRSFLDEDQSRPVILIMSWDLPMIDVPDIHIEHLMTTQRALHPEEVFRIYRATGSHVPAPPDPQNPRP